MDRAAGAIETRLAAERRRSGGETVAAAFAAALAAAGGAANAEMAVGAWQRGGVWTLAAAILALAAAVSTAAAAALAWIAAVGVAAGTLEEGAAHMLLVAFGAATGGRGLDAADVVRIASDADRSGRPGRRARRIARRLRAHGYDVTALAAFAVEVAGEGADAPGCDLRTLRAWADLQEEGRTLVSEAARTGRRETRWDGLEIATSAGAARAVAWAAANGPEAAEIATALLRGGMPPEDAYATAAQLRGTRVW